MLLVILGIIILLGSVVLIMWPEKKIQVVVEEHPPDDPLGIR